MMTNVPSPLDKISNLKPLSEERVAMFLERMEVDVIPKIVAEERKQRQLAEEMRSRILFRGSVNVRLK
jgi:hypothetical protein